MTISLGIYLSSRLLQVNTRTVGMRCMRCMRCSNLKLRFTGPTSPITPGTWDLAVPKARDRERERERTRLKESFSFRWLLPSGFTDFHVSKTELRFFWAPIHAKPCIPSHVWARLNLGWRPSDLFLFAFFHVSFPSLSLFLVRGEIIREGFGSDLVLCNIHARRNEVAVCEMGGTE
jgi:hypothetical protein